MPNCSTFISTQCTELKFRKCFLNENGISSLNFQAKVEVRFAEIMFSTRDVGSEPKYFWMVGAGVGAKKFRSWNHSMKCGFLFHSPSL